jgi:hypothetical protein
VRLQRAVGNAQVQRMLARRAPAVGPEGGQVPAEVEDHIHAARCAGQALEGTVRRRMEDALGADLSGVRVHDDARADALSRSLGARAFTAGRDVFFARGEYAPASASGQRLIAHELAHVVQQSGAPVQRALTVGPAGDAHEREADAVAEAIVSGEAPHAVQGTRAAAGRVQRWDSPEHRWLGDESGGAGLRKGEYITLRCHDLDLPQRKQPPASWPEPWRTLFAGGDEKQRRVLEKGLTYGEIIALAGDFFPSFEALQVASLREIYLLIPVLYNGADTAAQEKITGGRYLALAAENEPHFTVTDEGKDNLHHWRVLHGRAIRAARAGDANLAWALNAFADHYLTDAFSGGHLRVPRSDLKRQGTLGNIESKILHDLDNKFGVDVRNAGGKTWTAHGDTFLHARGNEENKALAMQAVRLSRQDLADALERRGKYPEPTESTKYAVEAILPRVIDPAKDRWTGRVPEMVPTPHGPVMMASDYTRMRDHVIATEGPDAVMGWPSTDDRVMEWLELHGPAVMARQSSMEKLRLIRTLLAGEIFDDELARVHAILATIPGHDMPWVEAALTPIPRQLRQERFIKLYHALKRR